MTKYKCEVLLGGPNHGQFVGDQMDFSCPFINTPGQAPWRPILDETRISADTYVRQEFQTSSKTVIAYVIDLLPRKQAEALLWDYLIEEAELDTYEESPPPGNFNNFKIEFTTEIKNWDDYLRLLWKYR